MSERALSSPPGGEQEVEIEAILATMRTVAVFGLSPDPGRPSHGVARYLQDNGIRIVPINPGVAEVLGEKAFPDLASVPRGIVIDVVDVFRRSEHVPDISVAAVERGARALWLQLGVCHAEAAARARAAGLRVVEDRCLKVEHSLRQGGAEKK